MITLKFDKLYQGKRKGEPCSAAIAVPKGHLKEMDKVIVSKNGRIYPSQTKVTSVWEDGSVRWFLVRFLTDLPGNEKTEYFLSYEGEVAGISSADEQGLVIRQWKTTDAPKHKELLISGPLLSLIPDGQGFRVDNGVLKFSVDTGENTSFKFSMYGGITYNAGNFYGPVLTDGAGLQYPFETIEWKAAEVGSVHVTLKGRGFHKAQGKKYPFEVRLMVCAGAPMIEVAYRLINITNEPLWIRSLAYGFRMPEETRRTCAAFSNANGRTHFEVGKNAELVECQTDGEMLRYEVNEHISETFYGTMFADCTTEHGGVCATIYQPWQNSPKTVRAQENGLELCLVPEGKETIVLQPGMARQQRFLIQFHDSDTSLAELNNISLIYQMPDRPWIVPQAYQDSDAVPGIFVSSPIPEVEFALFQKADSHARYFGMLHWGATLNPETPEQGSNNARIGIDSVYDYPHACTLQYLRTRTRRFLDYMFVSAEYLIDHWNYNKNLLLAEKQKEHSKRHVPGQTEEYSYPGVEGLLDYYHFTGEETAFECAIKIGENIQIFLDTLLFRQKGEICAIEISFALRALTALYEETWEKHWLDKCDWIINRLEAWEKEYGHWLLPATDNTSIRVVSVLSSVVGSLMRYYRIFPQEKVKAMILRTVEDMIENCYMDCGLFYDKELPGQMRPDIDPMVLEALTAAYELTKEKEYLTYGLQTFRMVLQTKDTGSGKKRLTQDMVIEPGNGTKHFAESFLPLVTYYKAAVECGLISNRRL